MSPWWLRPPAEEPVGDERPTGPRKREGSEGKAPSEDAVAEPRREPKAPEKSADRSHQRTSRRRSRGGGQAQRAGREGEEPKASSSQPRPRRRGRRGSPARRNGGTVQKDRPPLGDRRLAVICDLESAVLGVRESGSGHFDLDLVLERLLDKGKIIIKKAYADWDRHREAKRGFHQAGMELIDIPQEQPSGKSGVDIRIAVDAMELCYSKQHLDTFVLISADAALTPLVSKLKASNRHVIGIGSEGSASKTLIDCCDEYLFFEALRSEAEAKPQLENVEEGRVEVFTLLVEAIQALMRENQQVLWGSVVKQAIQRKHPSFNETQHGYSSFSKMLEEAEGAGVIRLRKDQRSGSYVVTGFGQVGR